MEPYNFSLIERKTLESIPSPFVVYQMNKIDNKRKVLLLSDGACRYFSLNRELLTIFLEKQIQFHIVESDLNIIRNYQQGLLNNLEEDYNISFRYKLSNDDNLSWITGKGNSKKIDSNNYLYYITYSTVTDEYNKLQNLNKFVKNINKENIECNKKEDTFINIINDLHQAMTNARFFYWVYDVPSKALISGNCFPELFKTNMLINNYPDFLFEQKLNHIDDKDQYFEIFNNVLNGAKNAEANIRVYDLTRQTYVLSHIRLNAIFDKNGKTNQIIGTSESLSTYEEMYKITQDALEKNGLITWIYHIESQNYNFSKPNIKSTSLLKNFELIKKSINSHIIIIPKELLEGKKESKNQILEIRDAEGRIKNFEITYSFINNNSHPPIYILGIARDVTFFYEKEAIYIKKLEKANINKSVFLSHLSHDMKTPLGAISTLSEFGLEETKDPIALSYFAKIQDNSKYLLSFISDVIEARNIDSSLFEIHPQIYKSGQIFFEIISVVTPRAEEKNISLYTQISQQREDIFVYCDVCKIKQIIINILNNAIKYTSKNGIVEFIIKSQLIENKVRILATIRDNGVGMSKQFQQHMFEEFTQEENRLSFEEEGIGLGLSIVKKTLEAMKGSIECNSELNKGTTFTISIDILLATQDQIRIHNNIASQSNFKLLQGKRVLICEDKPINIMIVKKLLLDKGIIVDVAENGKIGVDKTRENKYDIILMDIRMPVLDGLTASKIIRGFNKITPIIALSANAETEDVNKSLEVGINAYISKPINKEELYETIIKFTISN
ncbi:MAG: response regulator [Spirochaetaceae bacterium]|nr:response regulator [Spirochaetaceae bacterium]